jgi:4-hydroxy-tetrahydrodipicolinate reductase
MTLRVGVCGAGGRMGATACRAINGDDTLELVAAVDPSVAAQIVGGVTVAADVAEFAAAGCEVVVDFTTAGAARQNVPGLLGQGIHVVVGTSGLTDDDLAAFASATAPPGSGHVLVAANFSISAVLLMRLSELAAPFFDTAEIIELHHDGKVDAPSGTAITTAQRIAAASGDWAPDPTTRQTLEAARGATGPAGIHIHAVRMRGMVAHQEVIFGARGQTLTLRQDSYDRESFMPGVLLACKRSVEFPGLTIGLDALLDV